MSAKARYLACVQHSKSNLHTISSETATHYATNRDTTDCKTVDKRTWWQRATLQSAARSAWVALLMSLILISLVYFTSRGEPVATLPLPVNITPPDNVIHTDGFGSAMALDGDILVVGAPYTKVGGNQSQGRVYLYQRNGNSPTDFTFLKSIDGSEGGTNHYFSGAVGVDGDTVVVGSDRGFETRGAVYVFQRNQGGENNWGEVKRIMRADARQFTNFGHTVAIKGDILAVGAPLGYGEVQIFQRNQGGENHWGNTQILNAAYTLTPTIRAGSFGDAIAFDGTTLAIGAKKYRVTQDDLPAGSLPPPVNYSGAVFIFRQENGLWVREAKLLTSDIDLAANWFGSEYGDSLALNGDLLFVGERSGKVNGVYPGKVHVYQRGGGTQSTAGSPGMWGFLAPLTPNDGVDGDYFGEALYAVDNGVFISSQKQGIGRIYFFRNPTTVLGVADTAALHSLLSWSHIYSFTTSTGGATTFGIPIVGEGNSVLIGESSSNEGKGGIRAYLKDALFAYDPTITPTPILVPTETATPLPGSTPTVEPASCASVPSQRIYLPLVASGASTSGAMGSQLESSVSQAEATSTLNPTNNSHAASVTTVLAPGCVIDGPLGSKLGATADAISETLTISIAVTSAPTITLPASATVRSDYLHISAEQNRMAMIESPFVIGVPVPAGADTAHLVVMHTVSPEMVLDSSASEAQWSYLPGLYDAASNLFFARLPFMLRQGSTFVLVNHPDFDSPANPTDPPPAQAAMLDQAAAQTFEAWCMLETFTNPSHCTTNEEAIAVEMATAIYSRMTEVYGYPKTLRVLDTTGQFIVNEAVYVYQRKANYAIHLVSRNDPRCRSALGFYTPSSGFLALCIRAGNPIDEAENETLIHEMFHAFEYSYPAVMRQWELGREQAWAIEGMAEASVKSYRLTSMKRSAHYGATNLQDVDRPLTVGYWGDGNNEEYLAQDFWIYVSARHGRSLAYLHFVLAIGGAHKDQYDLAFRTLFNESFSENYWGWVKNQSIENIWDVGDGTGELCELSADALHTTVPAEFLANRTYWPYDTGSAFDHLQPLTAKVIELKFGDKISAQVGAGYRGCSGLTDPQAYAACVATAQQSLRVKYYIEGEPQCWNENLDGREHEGVWNLTNISKEKRYFAVVANINTQEEQGYFLSIE